MQNEHRLIARWKDILLYLDTYHLILHIGIENEKVDRGEVSQDSMEINVQETFIFGRGTPGAQETSATHTRFC